MDGHNCHGCCDGNHTDRRLSDQWACAAAPVILYKETTPHASRCLALAVLAASGRAVAVRPVSSGSPAAAEASLQAAPVPAGLCCSEA